MFLSMNIEVNCYCSVKQNYYCAPQKSIFNPVTCSQVHVWYQEGQTYDSVFQSIGSSYEECRAECVGLYLCGNHQVLEIFGHTPGTKETNDVIYVNWMSMARAGLLGMQFYDPTKKVWGQAHMQVIWVVLLFFINDFLIIEILFHCPASKIQ